MSTRLELPNLQNLPYPESSIPRDVEGAIEAIAKIMDIQLTLETPRTEKTLVLLCGVLMFLHLDRFQKMEIRSMLLDTSIIAPADAGDLNDLMVDLLVQPRWHLWSLTTEELVAILNEQQALVNIFAVLGISISLSAGKSLISEVIKKGKLGKGGYVFVIALSASYLVHKQYSNTKSELENRTPKPLTSEYY